MELNVDKYDIYILGLAGKSSADRLIFGEWGVERSQRASLQGKAAYTPLL